MTRDDIIRIAKEAGFYIDEEANEILESDKWHTQTIWVERFANLIAAAEREACAALCFQMWDKWLDKDARDEFIRPDAEDCAAAIRARGKV